MKHFADKNRRSMEFMVGEWVLVRLQPYRQHSVQLWKFQKLALQYFGPFQVVERVSTVAYHLGLPEHAKIHPVFHISQLKKYHGEPAGESYLPLPLRSIPEGPLCYPLQVLAVRQVQHNNRWVRQFLVRWEDDLQHMAPTLNLEDKVPIYEGVL